MPHYKEDPCDCCYIIPLDEKSRDLHYITVQVSKHRHVVAEFRGKTMDTLGFKVVSDPMRLLDAIDLAKELTKKRDIL